MGSAIAHRALAEGHQVTVWNRTPEKAEPLRAAGAAVASDAVSALRNRELGIVCLLDAEAIANSFDLPSEPSGRLDGCRVAIQSFLEPMNATACAAPFLRAGASVIKLATAGIPVLASVGQLTSIVSGDGDDLDVWEDALRVFSSHVVRCGSNLSDAAHTEAAMIPATAFQLLATLLPIAALRKADAPEKAARFLMEEHPLFSSPAAKQLLATIDAQSYEPAQFSVSAARNHAEASVRHLESVGIDSRALLSLRDWLATSEEMGQAEADFVSIFEAIIQKN